MRPCGIAALRMPESFMNQGRLQRNTMKKEIWQPQLFAGPPPICSSAWLGYDVLERPRCTTHVKSGVVPAFYMCGVWLATSAFCMRSGCGLYAFGLASERGATCRNMPQYAAVCRMGCNGPQLAGSCRCCAGAALLQTGFAIRLRLALQRSCRLP